MKTRRRARAVKFGFYIHHKSAPILKRRFNEGISR
jgi:hypothetical protein